MPKTSPLRYKTMKITTLGQEQTRKCPFCAESIRPQAIKCRYCGEFLNNGLAKVAREIASSETADSDNQQPEQEQTPDSILYQGRPSLWALAPAVVKALIIAALAYGLTRFELEVWFNNIFNLVQRFTGCHLRPLPRPRRHRSYGSCRSCSLYKSPQAQNDELRSHRRPNRILPRHS